VLVLTPQLVEFDTLHADFAERGHDASRRNVGRIECWGIPTLDIEIAVAGHGKAQFALQTQYLLDRLPETNGVVCTGGAGGLDPRLQVGDVVVGICTVEHDYRIRFVQAPRKEHPGNEIFLNELKFAAKSLNTGGCVYFDRIASGDEDIVDSIRAVQLRKETGAACVAWEGSGGARAAAFNGVPFVEIRGITDAANESAPGDYHEHLRIVMPRIAELLIAWRHRAAR
jgi:adenosylhomocysteine nucleosidase